MVYKVTPNNTASAPRAIDGDPTKFAIAAPDEEAAGDDPLTLGFPLGALVGVELALGELMSGLVELFDASVAAPSVVGFGTLALVALAAVWNMSNVFRGVALMEKTMPCWQWFACKQKNQSGLVSVTEKDHVGKSSAVALTGTNPDEIPTMLGVTVVFVNCVQGAANVDCVTVWFFEVKTKVTISLAAAVMFDGVYVRLLFIPTMTV